MRLSNSYQDRLAGIETADSVAVSAHKWLFQPKESGLVLFRDVHVAHQAISFGADYLAVPNIGVLGSHGAIALPLLATLLAWGRTGIQARIDACLQLADELQAFLQARNDVIMYNKHESGVILWRPATASAVAVVVAAMPAGAASTTRVDGQDWIRHVAANPNVDLQILTAGIATALDGL